MTKQGHWVFGENDHLAKFYGIWIRFELNPKILKIIGHHLDLFSSSLILLFIISLYVKRKIIFGHGAYFNPTPFRIRTRNCVPVYARRRFTIELGQDSHQRARAIRAQAPASSDVVFAEQYNVVKFVQILIFVQSTTQIWGHVFKSYTSQFLTFEGYLSILALSKCRFLSVKQKIIWQIQIYSAFKIQKNNEAIKLI